MHHEKLNAHVQLFFLVLVVSAPHVNVSRALVDNSLESGSFMRQWIMKVYNTARSHFRRLGSRPVETLMSERGNNGAYDESHGTKSRRTWAKLAFVIFMR
jgi:hypothetical protein